MPGRNVETELKLLVGERAAEEITDRMLLMERHELLELSQALSVLYLYSAAAARSGRDNRGGGAVQGDLLSAEEIDAILAQLEHEVRHINDKGAIAQ